MAVYKFHVMNDTFYTVDEVGKELPGLDSARAHAQRIAADIIHDELSQGRDHIHLSIVVENACGHRVASFRSTTSIELGEEGA